MYVMCARVGRREFPTGEFFNTKTRLDIHNHCKSPEERGGKGGSGRGGEVYSHESSLDGVLFFLKLFGEGCVCVTIYANTRARGGRGEGYVHGRRRRRTKGKE